MGNQLFQKAREAVFLAKEAANANGSSTIDSNQAIQVAKNSLSSAFANSTDAERAQLHMLQQELDDIQISSQ
jgi:hypothetical protein